MGVHFYCDECGQGCCKDYVVLCREDYNKLLESKAEAERLNATIDELGENIMDLDKSIKKILEETGGG